MSLIYVPKKSVRSVVKYSVHKRNIVLRRNYTYRIPLCSALREGNSVQCFAGSIVIVQSRVHNIATKLHSMDSIKKERKSILVTGSGGPWGSQTSRFPTFSRQSAHRWRWGCQPYAPAALYPLGRFLVLFSVSGWVEPRSIVRLEGLGPLINPMTSSRIKPATLCRMQIKLQKDTYRPRKNLMITVLD
jgi:hypothetical protein